MKKQILYITKGVTKYSRRGLFGGIFCKRATLICPQGPSFGVFCKKGSLNMPAGAFWAKNPIFEHLVLIADSESTENLVKIRTCSSSGLAFCVELWPKQVWYRISVPMSYI